MPSMTNFGMFSITLNMKIARNSGAHILKSLPSDFRENCRDFGVSNRASGQVMTTNVTNDAMNMAVQAATALCESASTTQKTMRAAKERMVWEIPAR